MGWQIETKTSKGWEFFSSDDDGEDEGAAREELARTMRADPANTYRMQYVPDADEEEDEKPATYKIVRGYFDDDLEREVIATGLTLEEAQAHCEDPETSSRTATSPEGVARTELHGPWFDRYTEE
jgi:hypothetical protein